MRNRNMILVIIAVLVLTTGCNASNVALTQMPNQQQDNITSIITAIPEASPADSISCPPTNGVGTIAPAISIYSITFLLNGHQHTLQANEVLPAVPGDEVRIRDVTICVGSFQGYSGQACVDFAPENKNGREVISEHNGTHLVQVEPGLILITDLNFTWTVEEEWRGIIAVVNHWAAEATQDSNCANGSCERDDQIFIGFR
jgi:hypothetical protein